MEETIDNLKNKFELITDTKNTSNFFRAIMDYHEYICESNFLKDILEKLIKEDLITPRYLENIFNDFITSQYLKFDIPKILTLPKFYNKEIESKYNLLKKYKELSGDVFSDTEPLKILHFNPNKPIINTNRNEQFYDIKKIYNEIVRNLEIKINNATNTTTLKEEMDNNDWTEIDINENDDYYIPDPKPIEKEEEMKEVLKNFKKRFEEFNCIKGLDIDYTYILSDEIGDMYFAEINYEIRLSVLENLTRIGMVKSWKKKKEIFNNGARFITAICKIDEDKFMDENKEKIIKQSNLFSHIDNGKYIIFSINGSDCYKTPKNNLYSKFFKLISKENKSDLNIGIIFNNLYTNKKEVLSEEQKIEKLKGILKQTKMGPLKNRKYDLSIRYNKNILSLSIKEVKN